MKLAPTTTAVATFYVRNSRTQIILRFTKKGESDMCDYSLHGIENRLAQEGEVLVVHRFYSGSKGLTSPEYLKPTAQPKGLIAMLKSFLAFPDQFKACAVCVPDGAKLMLCGIPPGLQEAHG